MFPLTIMKDDTYNINSSSLCFGLGRRRGSLYGRHSSPEGLLFGTELWPGFGRTEKGLKNSIRHQIRCRFLRVTINFSYMLYDRKAIVRSFHWLALLLIYFYAIVFVVELW